MVAVLSITDLQVNYAESVRALRGVSFDVPEGAVVAVLGANGAGKSTLLRALSRTLHLHRGRCISGSIQFDGAPLPDNATAVVRKRIVQVPEGRHIFGRLTVDENLRLGGFSVKDRVYKAATKERVLDLFPVLHKRAGQRAGLLSGGEQQMLAIGRALMASPRLLLLDEISLGLAPLVVSQIGDVITEINRQGTTVLLIEQNAGMALHVASRVVVMELGRVTSNVPVEDLHNDEELFRRYLGSETSTGASVNENRTLTRWQQ